MKKRGTKILAGLATVVMFAVTGFVSTQSIGGVATSEAVETVEYKMERNDIAPDSSILPDCRYLSDVEKRLEKGQKYVRINTKYYNPVLLVAPKDDYNKNGIHHVSVYTEKPGRNVKCLGDIVSDYGFKVIDGLIYIMENYYYDKKTGNYYGARAKIFVSKDGERLIQKDFINGDAMKEHRGYYGWTNCDENGNRHNLVDYGEADKLCEKFWYEWNLGAEFLDYKTKG